MPRNASWFFQQNPFTKDLPKPWRDRLERESRAVELPRRAVIWRPGDPADTVYLLRTGTVKLSKVNADGRELTLHLLQRNDLLGEFALLEGHPRETVAEAYEESLLYAIPVETFREAMRQDPSLFLKVAQLVAERRRTLENRIQGLLYKTAHARLAALFIELAERFGVRDARGVIINLKLTHREMASLIGSSRETVSFAILDFRKEGLILTEDKRVILLDPDRVKEIAAG